MLKAYIDCGKKCVGWSVSDMKQIMDCGLWRSGDEPLQLYTNRVTKVQVELPHYRPNDGRSQPNDLIQIAARGCWLAGAMFPQAELEFIYPVQWKGTLDGDKMTARILKHLNEEETELVHGVKCPDGLRHNVIDACGMALKEAFRL